MQFAITTWQFAHCLLLIDYPCLCLKRGFFLLMIYNLPFLRTILQSTLRFLMEALTFICLSFNFTCSLLAKRRQLLATLLRYRIYLHPIYLYRNIILPLVKS